MQGSMKRAIYSERGDNYFTNEETNYVSFEKLNCGENELRHKHRHPYNKHLLMYVQGIFNQYLNL